MYNEDFKKWRSSYREPFPEDKNKWLQADIKNMCKAFNAGKRSAMCEADSNAVLGDGFDINTAIKDEGNCKRQTVNCVDCKMGIFIFNNGIKTRLDDLCDHKIVYLLAKVVKIFS